MKVNAVLFWILSLFFGFFAVVYALWTWFGIGGPFGVNVAWGGDVEWVGTVGLSLTSALSTLIAFYVHKVYNAQGGELPEDRLDANIDDGDAEQGFFSPWSWWPIAIAAGATLVFLGLAVGIWIAFIGVPIAVIALVGWTYEYHRGYFGH